MVQKLVKDFIAQSHGDRPLQANQRDDVNDDEDLPSEHTVIDQPSYIDRERQSAESASPKSGISSADSDSRHSVDVRFTKSCIRWP